MNNFKIDIVFLATNLTYEMTVSTSRSREHICCERKEGYLYVLVWRRNLRENFRTFVALTRTLGRSVFPPQRLNNNSTGSARIGFQILERVARLRDWGTSWTPYKLSLPQFDNCAKFGRSKKNGRTKHGH